MSIRKSSSKSKSLVKLKEDERNSFLSSPIQSSSSSIEIETLKEYYNKAFHLSNDISLQLNTISKTSSSSLSSINLLSNTSGSSSTSPSSHIKLHGKKIIKVYKALVSLLYSTISIIKINEIETFIRNLSATLPISLIDLSYWENVLKYAKKCREDSIKNSSTFFPLSSPLNSMNNSLSPRLNSSINSSSSLKQMNELNFKIKSLEKKLNLSTFLCINPIRNIKDEFNLLKSSIENSLNHLQNEIYIKNSIIFEIMNKILHQNNNSNILLSFNSNLINNNINSNSNSNEDINKLNEELNKYKDNNKKLIEKSLILETKNEELIYKNSNLEQLIKDLKSNNDELKNQIDKLQHSYNNLLIELEQLNKEPIEERNHDYINEINSLKMNINNITQSNNSKDEQIKNLLNQLDENNTLIKNADDLVKEFQKKNQELEAINQELKSSEQNNKEEEISLLKAKIESLESYPISNKEFNLENEFQKKNDELASKIEELQKKLLSQEVEKNSEMDLLQNKIKELNQNILSNSNNNNEDILINLTNLNKELEIKINEIKSESLVMNNEFTQISNRNQKNESYIVELEKKIKDLEAENKLLENNEKSFISSKKLEDDEDDEEELQGLSIKESSEKLKSLQQESIISLLSETDVNSKEAPSLLAQVKEYIEDLTNQLEEKERSCEKLLILTNHFKSELDVAKEQLFEASVKLKEKNEKVEVNEVKNVCIESNSEKDIIYSLLEEKDKAYEKLLSVSDQFKAELDVAKQQLIETSKKLNEKVIDEEQKERSELQGPTLKDISSSNTLQAIDSAKLCIEIIENFKKQCQIQPKNNNNDNLDSIKTQDFKKLQQQHHQLIQAFYLINEQLNDIKRQNKIFEDKPNDLNYENLILNNEIIIKDLKSKLSKLTSLYESKKLKSPFLYSQYFMTSIFNSLISDKNEELTNELKYKRFLHNIINNEDYLNNLTKPLNHLSDFDNNSNKNVEKNDISEKIDLTIDKYKNESIDFHQKVIKIQKSIRGYLTRECIKSEKLDKIAQDNGVLVALEGTEQGQTGWYTLQKKIYYFCLYEGEFILLCGPLTQQEYRKAKKNITKLMTNSRQSEDYLIDKEYSIESLESIQYNSSCELPAHIPIEVTSIFITRYQIENLLNEVSTKDKLIKELEKKIKY